MKYIRTRNDKILDLDTMEFDWALPRENFVKSNAIKQADTIEELCDEFILEDRKDKINRHFTKLELVPCIYCYDKQNVTVYGAIWTDKGLIYVAKMNDKGEFELL